MPGVIARTFLVTPWPTSCVFALDPDNWLRPIKLNVDGSIYVAQQVNVMLVDDIDGSEASETVSFGLDGRHFEIDLSENHAAQLRDALVSFVAAARRRDGGTRVRSSAPRSARPGNDREHTSAIREWARANGHTVSDRGRISKVVVDAYENRDAVKAPAEESAPSKKSRKRSLKVAG